MSVAPTAEVDGSNRCLEFDYRQDAYAQTEVCIPYTTNTHIRSEFDDGSPIDLNRVWKIFAQAGFKGFVSAEYEGENAGTGVLKLTATIRNSAQNIRPFEQHLAR